MEDGSTVYVDRCIANIVQELNYILGLKTLGCCCGHGKYPMTIVVEKGFGIFELVSGKLLPRKKKFYKKDKEGNYFIPESIEEGEIYYINQY